MNWHHNEEWSRQDPGLKGRMDKALAEVGIVDDKYGDVPVILRKGAIHPEGATIWYIEADDRELGCVRVFNEGDIKVELDVARWINPQPPVGYNISAWETIGMGIHNPAGVVKFEIEGDLSDVERKMIERITADEEESI